MRLLDTSCWIHALRKSGDPEVKERVWHLLREGEVCWCDMVRVELYQGAVQKAEVLFLEELDQDLVLLPTDREVWSSVCALSKELRKAGSMVPFTDRLIYSCASVHRVELEHRDQHFDVIEAALEGRG